MGRSENIILELLKKTDQLGLPKVTPEILSDAGNLIVHLYPYPIVARIAKLFDGDYPAFWKCIWEQELKIVEHLMNHQVPVVSYITHVPPGPHKVGSSWMTLWDYVAKSTLPPLDRDQAIDMLNDMTMALNLYQGPLQRLGAWKNVDQAVENLKERNDKDARVIRLLQVYEDVNKNINHVDLYPAHGDAHPKNLIPSSKGWRWIDFEDVSLMPKFWDIASFIGNTALFHGLKHPMVDYALNLKNVSADRQSIQFALKARVIMSITMNLSLALEGNGNLDFATSQLDSFDDFLSNIESKF